MSPKQMIRLPLIGVFAALALAACGDALTSADATNTEAVKLGAKIYAAECASCHGENLQGEPNWRVAKADGVLPAPPHNDDGHTWHHADSLLFNYTQKGGQGMGPEGFQSGMPGFGDTLSDEEIWSVLSFIKSRWSIEAQIRQARMN